MRVLALLCVVSLTAHAGERFLGAIVSSDGADTTNDTTESPFYIPSDAKLTVWCNAGGYVITDTRTAASATTAMPVNASEKFPTSTGSQIKSVAVNAAAGGAIVRIFGTAAITCYVFERRGNE